jgi:hypothetical protein
VGRDEGELRDILFVLRLDYSLNLVRLDCRVAPDQVTSQDGAYASLLSRLALSTVVPLDEAPAGPSLVR